MSASYDQLVTAFASLNAKISAFVNGGVNSTVPTAAGSIKTLSGLARDVSSLRYTQKINDCQTLALAINTLLSSMLEGELVRIWGDAPGVNGIYQVTNAVFVKISYSEMYDLRDYLPNPWNYVQVKATESQTASILPLASFKLPVATATTSNVILRGTIAYVSSQAGSRGSYSADFQINVIAGGVGEAQAAFVLTNRNLVALDSPWTLVVDPILSVVVQDDVSNHNFVLTFQAPTLNGTAIVGDLDVRFNGVDPVVSFNVSSILANALPNPLPDTNSAVPDFDSVYSTASAITDPSTQPAPSFATIYSAYVAGTSVTLPPAETGAAAPDFNSIFTAYENGTPVVLPPAESGPTATNFDAVYVQNKV